MAVSQTQGGKRGAMKDAGEEGERGVKKRAEEEGEDYSITVKHGYCFHLVSLFSLLVLIVKKFIAYILLNWNNYVKIYQ